MTFSMKKLQLFIALAASASLSAAAAEEGGQFIQCADLSYVNEMLDAGVEYRMGGQVVDPYEIFKVIGTDMVRVRLWNNPEWSGGYSTFDDVVRTIRASKAAGMQVMLNFHYSDSWTDPGKQIIPAEWAAYVDDVDKLGDLLYDYTYNTLRKLDDMGLMPEVVQVGNENNNGVMNADPWSQGFEMDWERHVKLFNRGIQAVRDASRDSTIKPKVMIHVAQPHNLEYWFKNAFAAGLADIDYIGFSYYTPWCPLSKDEMALVVNRVQHMFQTKTFMVEAAYPWTLLWNDEASNMVGDQALQRGYPATIRGQREFMTDMTQVLIDNGCAGLAYWEPAWVSSDRKTLWGTGSHWENMTFFDFRKGKNELHAGCEYLKHKYIYPTPVEFRVIADDSSDKLYFWADYIGGCDFAIELKRNENGEFIYKDCIKAGTEIKFGIFKANPIKDDKLAAYAIKQLQSVRVGGKKLILKVSVPGRGSITKGSDQTPAGSAVTNAVEDTNNDAPMEDSESADMLDFINSL